MQTPKWTERKKKKEKLIEKHCMFFNEDGERCPTIFFGTGRSRFCMEHRKPRYRKIIDAKKIAAKKEETIANTANFIINHKYAEATELKRNCDACGIEYSITLFPGVYVISRYCENHRNQWKRELYLSQSK